jgi:hypothetical protein
MTPLPWLSRLPISVSAKWNMPPSLEWNNNRLHLVPVGGTRTGVSGFPQIDYSATTDLPPEAYGLIAIERRKIRRFRIRVKYLMYVPTMGRVLTNYSVTTSSLALPLAVLEPGPCSNSAQTAAGIDVRLFNRMHPPRSFPPCSSGGTALPVPSVPKRSSTAKEPVCVRCH